jgi:hypothetical protein
MSIVRTNPCNYVVDAIDLIRDIFGLQLISTAPSEMDDSDENTDNEY